MQTLLFILSGAALAASVILVLGILSRRQKAKVTAANLHYLNAFLDRAIMQLKSGEEEEILAGLQAVYMLNDPQKRMRAIPVIARLIGSSSPRVERQAMHTYSKLLVSLEGSDRMAGEELARK
jgi:hypothetical protein